MKQVTAKEARDILGNEAVKMSDDEVRSLIDDLSVMAKWALEEARHHNSVNKQDIDLRNNNE